VQLLAAAMLPPDNETFCEPGAAVIVPLPQLPVRPLGVATIKPAGNGSLNAMPLRTSDEFGFVIAKVKLVELPKPIAAEPNVFAMLGAPPINNVAVAAFPVPPFVEETVPVVFV
jgi:hypothetical protein